jgi:phosphoglycolate phosphatase
VTYRLIVFDWDGTILDSPAAIAECMRASCKDLELAVPEVDQAKSVIGLGMQDLMRVLAPTLPLERYPEFIEAYRRHFRACEPALQLFSGMRELIEDLSSRFVLGIATAKSRRGLDRALDASGLRAHFRASRTADECQPKPHPAMLLEILNELSVAPQNALMIGDTSHDLKMAQAAGVDALAMTYGAHPEDGLRACGPMGCFGDVASLAQWLKTNG